MSHSILASDAGSLEFWGRMERKYYKVPLQGSFYYEIIPDCYSEILLTWLKSIGDVTSMKRIMSLILMLLPGHRIPCPACRLVPCQHIR